jgi:MoaA/NifB/PqqE/SkfB family radical SAM enzyme
MGVLDGRRAFVGPEHVVIDLTNRCNEQCLGCWTYSPLLGEKAPAREWVMQELRFEVVKKLINELAKMGTKRIRFTGGGEPFLHPQIMELIEYVKKKGMICAVTTNFTPINEKRLQKLMDGGIDDLAVSLWAGSPQTYVRMHPGRTVDDYMKIVENLRYLSSRRNGNPFITLCNVISNLNYLEAEAMWDLALDVKANAIYFTVVDTVPGKTDALLLSEEQSKVLIQKMNFIKQKAVSLPEGRKIKLDNFEGFMRRIADKNVSNGEYDKDFIDTIPCYIGWTFVRIMANGDVCPCCRGVSIPTGNVNQQSFSDIWHGELHREFRCKAKYAKKTDPYFAKVKCYKTCDNLMHNIPIHERTMHLSALEKKMLLECRDMLSFE